MFRWHARCFSDSVGGASKEAVAVALGVVIKARVLACIRMIEM